MTDIDIASVPVPAVSRLVLIEALPLMVPPAKHVELTAAPYFVAPASSGAADAGLVPVESVSAAYVNARSISLNSETPTCCASIDDSEPLGPVAESWLQPVNVPTVARIAMPRMIGRDASIEGVLS
ncbi:MAG: hypothetical protein ACREN6_15435 [Gemmatimonadaceae bacterium]